jgi:uncharacterized damage-inducible protein DinB
VTDPEAWLRGPVDGIPASLQPVAHALIQARDEVRSMLLGFPDHLLWERPAGVASVGFHLQHMTGVIDRLLTYARDEQLSEHQRSALAAEGKLADPSVGVSVLLDDLSAQVERALAQLKTTLADTLGEARGVGTKRLPSTVLGLLFHAAEHVQRHAGQLLVTAKVVRVESRE